jgi:drug/metabolite transporter (DMT)-like permease
MNDRVPASNSTSPMAGRLWIAAAALFWSTSGLFVKAPLFTDWPVGDRGLLLAFWRALFAALVLVAAVRRPRWTPGLVPLVASFTGMNAVYLTAMSLTTAANAIWLQSTCPFWVLLVTVTMLRQRVAGRDLLPLAFAALGVGTILWFEIGGTANTGVLLGLVSGLLFGLVVICMWRLRDEDSAWLVALCHGVAALAILPWAIRCGVWPSAFQLAVLAAFGVLQMALPYLCLIRGLRGVNSQEAVAIGLIEPVVMPLWVFLVWGERPAWWTLLGAGLILAGLLLRYIVVGNGHEDQRRTHT